MIRPLALTLLLAATPAFAQLAAPTPTPPLPPLQLHGQGRPMTLRMERLDRADQPTTANIVPPGTWWRSPETIKTLNLTPDQQRKLDDTFRQSRLQLIDLKASLEKEQLNLEPLLNANPPDTNKAMSQISRIADLRADLEKANARMLLGLRAQLTADQWTKLQADRHVDSIFMKSPATLKNTESHVSSNKTCTKNQSTGQIDCTLTTVTPHDENGRAVVTTCVTLPGQSSPKCTTVTAGSAQSSDAAFPWDGLSIPPTPITLDLPKLNPLP